MRLSDDILRASDECALDYTNKAFMLAAAGRFGLLANARPFMVQINAVQNQIEVVSLDCLAITKGGDLIDVQHDGNYSGTLGNVVYLPEDDSLQDVLLLIHLDGEAWLETDENFEEPSYVFSAVPLGAAIDAHSLPLAHLVKSEYGWQLDTVNFVPPCLFVSSHYLYQEELNRFMSTLQVLDEKCCSLTRTTACNVLRIFWTAVRNGYISLQTEADTMTPTQLLAEMRKVVNSFIVSMQLDEHYGFASSEELAYYNQVVMNPCSFENVYLMIKKCNELCLDIDAKLDLFDRVEAPVAVTPSAPKAPTIADTFIKCTNVKAKIVVINNEPGAEVHYTINGGTPTSSSPSGTQIPVQTGFMNGRNREPDKTVTVKVVAMLNGMESEVKTYEITLHKSISSWNGINI